jgi:hypothetical protein
MSPPAWMATLREMEALARRALGDKPGRVVYHVVRRANAELAIEAYPAWEKPKSFTVAYRVWEEPNAIMWAALDTFDKQEGRRGRKTLESQGYADSASAAAYDFRTRQAAVEASTIMPPGTSQLPAVDDLLAFALSYDICSKP